MKERPSHFGTTTHGIINDIILIPSNFLSNTQIDPINDRIIRLMFSKRIIVEDICNKIMHALFYKDIYLKTEKNELYSTYWE